MLTKPLKEALLACLKLTEERINLLLPENFSDSKIVDAMRYSALSDAKRIRPFLTIIISQIFGISPSKSLNTAAALELIHTYSLIHDDLPAMDDDDFRRGKKSCHKKYDEATAILAGDALLTYAFEILSDKKTSEDAEVRCELINLISASAGFKGMVGGQMIDIETGGKKISKTKLMKLHRLKTGELFLASCLAGAILGKAENSKKIALQNYASDFGLAFQIRDDLLDYQEDISAKEKIGKNSRPSIVDLIGYDEALQELELLKKSAINHLKIFENQANILIELIEFISKIEPKK